MPKKKREDLDALRLPELLAKFAEVTGKETKSPNKRNLIRKITETLGAGDEDAAKPEDTTSDASTGEGEEKISKLSVGELRAKYLEIVGRETKSTNRPYLIWRVQQALKGRIPVGPGRGRSGESIPHKVLPVRVPTAAVPTLDEAWKRLGMKTRTLFFRRAVHDFLETAGEKDAATLFAVDV